MLWATNTLKENLLDGANKKALDVGCAYGYTSRILSKLGYDVFGIDVSVWGLKQAKLSMNNEFLACDVQASMPFKDGIFDLVTCFDVLEHLHNPEKALVNMFESCKSTLICTTPNKKVEKPIRKLLGDYDETHINVKTSSDWYSCVKKLLVYNDLKVESFYDLAGKLAGKLFFKSVNLPTYGLTVRIAVRK